MRKIKYKGKHEERKLERKNRRKYYVHIDRNINRIGDGKVNEERIKRDGGTEKEYEIEEQIGGE